MDTNLFNDFEEFLNYEKDEEWHKANRIFKQAWSGGMQESMDYLKKSLEEDEEDGMCCDNPNVIENWVGHIDNKFKVCKNCKKEI
jgi:hypothetical protein